MSVHASTDYGNLENNENVQPIDVNWHIKDEKNYSGSQEIFSDDDRAGDISCNSPRVSVKNDTINSSVISIKTPTLCTRANEVTPGRAIVPKTPVDLLPHIKKTSFLWTSDMETPQSKINEQSTSCDKTFNSIDNVNKTPTRPKTPPQENMEINPKDVPSPVLGGKKRPKRKVKRRIINNINLDLDSNNDRQSNASSDKVPSETTTSSPNSEVAFEIQKEVDNCAMMENNNLNNVDCKENKSLEDAVNVDCKENKLLEEAVITDKNSNTSTQDFFSNISLGTIDNLCSTAIQEEKVKENSKSKNVSNDVLERVAAIMKNQKPIRPSTDTSHTVIPKEAFSKSVMELELADAKFSQEKRPAVVNKVKSLPLMSFSKLSSLHKDNEDEIPSLGKNVINNVPEIAVNNQKVKDYGQSRNNQISVNSVKASSSKTIVRKESFGKICDDERSKKSDKFEEQPAVAHIKDDFMIPDNQSYQSSDGFSTAKGRGISISEDKLLRSAKIYQEIEKEIPDESVFLGLKQKKEQPKKLPPILGRQTSKDDKKTEKLKLYQDLELKEFLVPKSSPEDMDLMGQGFSTARGDEVAISKEKENLYLKVYNELSDDVDFGAAKKPKPMKSVINQTSKNSLSNRKVAPTSTVTSSDGFSTAHGGVYNEMSNVTDFGTAKRPNAIRTVINQPVKSSDPKKIEIPSSRTSSDGFATARGGGIAISNEKEKEYLNFYSELDDIDEDSLLNIKKNKQPKLCLIRKPTDKAVIVFNKKAAVKPNVKAVEIPSAKSSNDGFSTAKGIGIAVSDAKESHYLRIYNELSDEIPGDAPKTKLPGKPLAAPKQIKSETVAVKQENKDDNVLEDIGDLNEFFSPPHQTNYTDAGSNFVVPNSSNILKKVDAPVVVKKEVSDNEEDRPAKNVIGFLKRKLDDCDGKRTGRCRSFGGFPASGEGVSGAKLNKSDPHNDSSVNHPLGLSASQCFDAHSDSWMSKMEISHLNGSRINSPKVRQQKKDNVASGSKSRNCSGFTAEENLQSFRLCTTFSNFLRKKRKKGKDEIALNVEAGQSITITVTNRTSSGRHVFLQQEKDVDMKRRTQGFDYVLVDAVPKKIERVETSIAAVELGKRKHADTDSDTPLTSVKKPRVGSELQGRKLFSDESDDEERVANDVIPQFMETQEMQVEAEEEEVDLSEERMDATMLQEKKIRNKKRMKIKPIVGSLFSERLANSTKRTSWSQLVGSSVPMPLSTNEVKQKHPDAKILEVTASSATCYTFLSFDVTGKKNIVSLDVGDGALLIFDSNDQAGAAEFSQAFLAMPGVDPKLLPAGWVENHYRWIVWKLAALDRIRFGAAQLPKSLTPQRVMSELKYRYDREIDKAQRPALRRILEKDDLSSRRMVLCISSIKECAVAEETDKEVRTMLGLPRWKVEATDGWYDIPLTIDSAMADYISTGKIKEGTKIITYGAELLECERGYFPLEKPPSVSLKIHMNCTRRAKWDTKLGYQKTSRPLPVKLRDIIESGGMVGEITAAAARVYPVLYREKTADGKSIYRNARCEEKAVVAHEKAIERRMDAMYAEAQKNFDSKKSSEFDEDLEVSQTQITHKFNSYERKQEQFKRELESQVRQGLPPQRKVTTVMKVRLVDDSTTVILSIWGAGEESDCDIREGDTVSVYNCFASGRRGGDLNLTASRITHIKTEPLLKIPYPNRVCTLIPEIVAGFEPKFGEFDTVGVVVSSGTAPYGMKNFEMVNIAYPKPDDSGSSYLSVLFWNGVASFGYQGMFTPGSLVACSNLEWRRNLWSIAVAYCSEKSVFTGNPRQAHLMKELRNLKALVQNPHSYAESCVEEVAAELTKKPQRPSQGTPTSWSIGDRSVSFASPADNYTPGKATIQMKLDKLSRYGSSPEISPIVLNSSSTRLKKDFTPVTRRNT